MSTKAKVVQAKIVREVTVRETGEKRRVFYTLRARIFDEHGVPCQTPLELGIALGEALNRRDKDTVSMLIWNALNFVYDGNVSPDFLAVGMKCGARPLVIDK